MPSLQALVAAFGIGESVRKKALRKTAKRWSGLWTMLLVLDTIRYFRRRKRKIIARRVLKNGDVLVISNSVDPKKS